MLRRHLQSIGLLAWLSIGQVCGVGTGGHHHSRRSIQPPPTPESSDQVAVSEDTVSSISPTSVTAGTTSVITFTGMRDGLADFFASCSEGEPSTQIQNGQGSFTLPEEKAGTGLKLCIKLPGGEVKEQAGISLTVVSFSKTRVVHNIIPPSARRNTPTLLTLVGAKRGKASIVKEDTSCSGVAANTELDEDGRGTFTIEGELGTYKVCYSAPGGTDSAEQQSSRLKVIDDLTTKANQVTFISPNQIAVNVPTAIALIGAKSGDKAVFIPFNQSCDKATPTTDMSTGNADFVLSKVGKYKLCLRSAGSIEAVEQQGVHINVNADSNHLITVQWTSKQGTIDCSVINQVPYCASQGIETCETSYSILSGIGYTCTWDTTVWPPTCMQDYKTTDRDKICKTHSCGGAPSQCW
mmetsp:Transcript_38945/g.70285  ORF Transcript_38945/g.70285 Transcript_38945/m.70285 type:complete len:409 (-) Transcript_38945:153-1379(-)